MSTIMIIYYFFFIVLCGFTISVFVCLCIASGRKLSSAEINSVESFMLLAYPRFPALTFAKILPGTFVGFGILGTFLGFAQGISGIDMHGSSEEIFDGISTLLSGINTAFYTSIFGVVLSVFFSITFQFPIHKIKARINKQKSISESAKIDTSMQDYVNQVRELTTNLVSAKESLGSLPEKFNEVGKALEESIAPVKETFGQMQSTLQNYAEQAKSMESASSAIGETFKSFSEINEKITQNISEIFEKSEAMNKNIIEENQTLTESHKQTLENYKTLSSDISSMLEKLDQNIAEYSSKITENTSQILNATSENFKTTAAEIHKKFTADISEENKTLLQQRTQDLESYKQLDENISSALEKLNENVAEYSKTMENTLVETLENFTKAAERVSNSLLGLGEANRK